MTTGRGAHLEGLWRWLLALFVVAASFGSASAGAYDYDIPLQDAARMHEGVWLAAAATTYATHTRVATNVASPRPASAPRLPTFAFARNNAAKPVTGAADDLAEAGVRATAHGAERLEQAGFTDDLVAATKAGHVTRQANGATVYVNEATPGRFDFIVEGERGVITAHRNWRQGAVDRLAKNYGWEGWPP